MMPDDNDGDDRKVVHLTGERTVLRCALSYIRLGWWVVPVAPGTKQPDPRLCPHGHKNATNNPEQAREWWLKHPECGIGIAMRQSGLVGLDVDPRNGGQFTLEQLAQRHGVPIESDVTAITGGGGNHLFFLNEGDLQLPGTLGPGIDVKCEGILVVEPSIHPLTGKMYCWEASSDPLDGALPPPMPGWLRDIARQRMEVAPLAGPAAPVSPILQARLDDVTAALQHVEAETRESWLMVGMAIHSEMPNAQGYDLWCRWSQTSAKYDPADQLRTWKSLKHRGLEGRTMNSIFAAAQASGWVNPGTVPSVAGLVPIAPLPAGPSAAESILLDVEQLAARAAATRWVVKGVMPANSVGLVFGASGTFKSFVAIDACLDIVHGRDWCGKRTTQGETVYVAAEGGAGLIRRIQGWHLKRGLDWRACRIRVVILPLDIIRDAPKLAEAIAEMGLKPVLIVIDTLSQTFTGDENAATEVAAYLRACLEHLAQPTGAAVAVVAHTGHSTTERPRGSSALLANVDWAWAVRREVEDAPVAIVECVKMKDGEKFANLPFLTEKVTLGTDEDGDPITTLVATYNNNAENILATAKAMKGERARTLLECLQPAGMPFADLRKAFCEAYRVDPKTGSERPANTINKGWKEAHEPLTAAGVIEVVDGFVRFGSAHAKASGATGANLGANLGANPGANPDQTPE
jgi:hypothetical protein